MGCGGSVGSFAFQGRRSSVGGTGPVILRGVRRLLCEEANERMYDTHHVEQADLACWIARSWSRGRRLPRIGAIQADEMSAQVTSPAALSTRLAASSMLSPVSAAKTIPSIPWP